MLRNLIEKWPAEITLVPYSGIQILDFGLNIDAGGRGSMAFSERMVQQRDEGDVWQLFPHSQDDDLNAQIPPPRIDGDEDYSISKVKALEPFLNRWTPAPLLRIRPGAGPRGQELFDAGPSTWARFYVLELDQRDPEYGYTHRLILAVDTDLSDAPSDAGDDEPYLAPTVKDSADESEFRLATNADQMAWFLRREVEEIDGSRFDQQKWVDDWLDDQYKTFRQAQRPNRELRPEDFPFRFEHWARYLACLALIGEAVRPPKIRLLDTVSEDQRYQCIEVDLVLDIGNSRSCGILVESYPDDPRVDLNNSFALSMRDLGRPELYYRRPFESRIEFAQVDFGPEHISRRSGRSNPAFLWPSLVRVGPEATRLVQGAEGTETLSGLSSPKRYLWDTQPVNQDWRFQSITARQTLPLIARSAFRFLNEAGDVISQVTAEEDAKLRSRNETSKTSAIRPRFSRSSLYSFMLSELIIHALVQINDPASRATRKQSDLPRRLRNIILTLPSATPMQEQAIMRSRAEAAIRLTWSILGWRDDQAMTCKMPTVMVEWDEASCTQLVWLYDEIAQKFGGQIESFFALHGRKRQRPPPQFALANPTTATRRSGPEESLRVACIDIGGGTTDLMVTTYYSDDNRAILPVQNVREGFRIAGDDLVQEVVSRVVLPQIGDQIQSKGGSFINELFHELFGGDVGDVEEQVRQRRRQFSIQILTPIALAMLEACESLSAGDTRTLHLTDIVGTLPQPDAGQPKPDDAAPPELAVAPDIVGYLQKPARERGAVDWALATVAIDVNPNTIDEVVRDVLGPALEPMLELIDHLAADVVLLSGRPTRLLPVADLVREAMVVRPDRIIAMHEYRVGGWYPYRDRVTNKIGDPKTTAAVGGMLCLLAANRIMNFKLETEQIHMRSTARYIGEMERNGQIFSDRVLMSDVDLQAKAGADDTAEVLLRSPMHIGFRQLPHDRWIASPLYRLDFANENAQKQPTPFRVVLRRRDYDQQAETQAEALRAEALKEAFVIEEVEDAGGSPCSPRDVKLTLHTLGVDETDYWLDTGIFRIN